MIKRIGLTQRVDVVSGYEERRDCLDQRWAILMVSLGFCPVPLANGVVEVEAYVSTLRLDGVVLTGGNDLSGVEGGTNVAPERDRFEHLLLEVSTRKQLPVLGVCRGVQIMNVHYGGDLVAISHHARVRHEVSVAPERHDRWPRSISVNSFHNFAITESVLAYQLNAIAWAEDESIEAVAHESSPQLGVMWHPEREEVPSKHDLSMIRELFGGEPA